MAGKPLRELASQTQRALEEGRSVRDDLRNEKVTITKLVKYIKDYDQRVKEETAALKDVPKAIESAKAEIKAMVSRNTKVIEKAIKDLEKAAKKPSTQIAKLETKAFDEAVLRLDEKVADAVANIKLVSRFSPSLPPPCSSLSTD
jgi:predicted RNase H-like nuclease (RuvC/YqgF family)